MRIGAMLGREQAEALGDSIARGEKRDIERKQAREIAKKRRLGKTIRYRRED